MIRLKYWLESDNRNPEIIAGVLNLIEKRPPFRSQMRHQDEWRSRALTLMKKIEQEMGIHVVDVEGGLSYVEVNEP